jgi:1,4-alpha-glucan branching enzyme
MAADEFDGNRSWGYNPAYIFSMEAAYGGVAALRQLVQEAHRRGIAVLMDVVYNHLGTPALDMWTYDGWGQNGGGGIYFYNDWRRTTPWGDTRLDYGRGEVRQYIRDNALYLLEDCGLDGLRFDATGWIRNVYNDGNPSNDLSDGWNLLQWLSDEVRQRQPWKILIAEDMQRNEWITKPTSSGGAGFNSQWDPQFVHGLKRMLVTSADRDRSMALLRDLVYGRYNGDGLGRVIYTESHDEDHDRARIPEEIWWGNADSYFSKKRSTLGAAVVMTAPGIPMIFQGQEFLEWGSFDDGSELDWSKTVRFSGIRDLYRDLIRLRRNWFDTTRGLRGQHVHVHHVNDWDKVLAYHRWDRGGPRDDTVVLLNMADRAYDGYRVGFPRPGRWRVRFNSDWSGYDPSFGNRKSLDLDAVETAADNMPCSGTIGLGAYSAVVLSQDG